MTQLDILKNVAIAMVLLFIAVAGVVYLNPFDPIFKFASVVALGVVATASSLVFFYAAVKSNA